MEGGFEGKKVEITAEDKKNILNAEIGELERRKGILVKEVEDYYRAYKNKLDLDYNTLVGKIEESNIQRQRELNLREDSIVKKEALFNNQNATKEAELRTKLELADKKIQQAVEDSKNYAILSADLKATQEVKDNVLAEDLYKTRKEREDLAKEKVIVKEIQDKLTALEAQNQETQRRLSAVLKDAESRQAYLVYWEGEIKKKDDANILSTGYLSTRKIDLDNRELAIVENEEKTKKLLEQAEQILQENKKLQEELNKLIADNKEQGESLAKWRDELDERERSAGEKDRYYIIREREIDAKIRILNKLRESEGGK